MSKTLIIGNGGFTKQIYETLISLNLKFELHDDTDPSKKINIKSFDGLIVAVSGTKNREKIKNRYPLPHKTIISKGASVSSLSRVGEGSIILNNTIIEPDAIINEHSIINVGAQVHHDCKIGKYCEIAPKSVLLGGCQIGDYSFIGANATVLPGVKIGKNVTIGAGAVVVKDVPDDTTAKGVPAK